MPLDPHAVASPVDWLEWSSEAFERARREDKPILLRISAMWCHWCHVMDETTDSDPEVARRINEWFVPVRVDNDERPDINDRYNLGGWPTTAFLTPDGELITGGTYFPAAQFLTILERIHQGWSQDRTAVQAEVERIREHRSRARAESRSGGGFDARTLASAVEAVLDAFDWRYGGFGTQPKFPQPEAVRLLLHAHAGTAADAPLRAAVATLDAMRSAGLDAGRAYGLYDHEAGGFFRYSTTRDWTEPHFEKMAEDNARLALAYLDGHRITGAKLYRDTVRGIFDFVVETLSDPAGGAYGSQDADGEASYYGLSLAERAPLPEPVIDRRFYANWNGMLVTAACEAAAALEWPDLLEWAFMTYERLEAALMTPDGMRHVLRPPYDDAGDQPPLLLTDQAWWLRAHLAVFQATGREEYRLRATRLAQTIETSFFDAERGACRDRRVDETAEAVLADPHYPVGANAAAAIGFATLSALGEDARWRERAETIVDGLAAENARLGFLGAPMALAATYVFDDPVRVHIIGSSEDARVRALWSSAWGAYAPGRVTEILDPALDGDRIESLGYSGSEPPLAFVCIGDRCLEPASDPGSLTERLASSGTVSL